MIGHLELEQDITNKTPQGIYTTLPTTEHYLRVSYEDNTIHDLQHLQHKLDDDPYDYDI